MRSNCLSILLICALTASALRVPFRQSKKTLHRRSFGMAQSKPVVMAVGSNDDDDDLRCVGLESYPWGVLNFDSVP